MGNGTDISIQSITGLKKGNIEIIQINLGDLCNLNCTHCHINASPRGHCNMDSETAHKILAKLITMEVEMVEFTGGAPEMNPNLPYFIEELSRVGIPSLVRTNLTILDSEPYSELIGFFHRHNVKLVASLPGVFRERTDRQRGKGTFDASIKVLRRLNEVGYGTGGISLDLVYNPDGDYLPPSQCKLEAEYRQLLKDQYDIQFSNLVTIVNAPIKRFKTLLTKEGRLDSYMKLLGDHFNPDTLDKLMCRHLMTIDYKGIIYDCDFNLALGVPVTGYETTPFWEIDFDRFSAEITVDRHCLACTVNAGSSCHGTLVKEKVDFDEKGNSMEYYGEILAGTSDLKTSACCTTGDIPRYVKDVMPYIPDEIVGKYYGCGSPIPEALNGMHVMDLGCGTGRDTYVLSRLVGESGHVLGLDCTPAQISVARKYLGEQTEKYGYSKPNVDFIEDGIENMSRHVEEASLDMITSNCVLNLLKDKELVFHEIFRALKQGGELYFSDVYCDRRLPAEIRQDPVLHGECLGGALYTGDFIRIARRVGFADPRVVTSREIELTEPDMANLLGNARFYSITYRLWKIEGLEDACEDYGHVAVYNGGLETCPHRFVLDREHAFERNRPERICGNTARMLSGTRFRLFFDVSGTFGEHFGAFEGCGTIADTDTKKDDGNQSGCCC